MGHSKLKVVRAITDLSPDCYRLSTDGRKWKSLCEARQKLANWLALKGNPDGTQIFPGINKMVRVTRWSHGKVCYVLSDLEIIGCVVNENTRTKERGTCLRRFNPLPLLKANEAINRGERFCHATIQDSLNLESSIQELQSKIEKPTVQDTKPQSKIEGLQSNAGLDATVDRPIKPTTTTEKKLVAVEWLSRFGHKKLGSFPINRRDRNELQALSDRDGLGMFKRVCKKWYEERSFEGLNYPAGKLLEEYEGHLSAIQGHEQFKVQNAALEAGMERAAEKRRQDIEQHSAEAAREKELAASVEPF